jgi:hypothetical protein
MIVTDHFVYIHVSRSGGTFLNKLIMEYVPGARMLQYHGHLKDLPVELSHLPVIGFVRNPWDWYVSMFADYPRKQQYVFQILSDRGTLDFEATVSRFLTLGDDDAASKKLLRRLATVAPRVIDARRPTRSQLPGLRSEHFKSYPSDTGYYSWLVELMFESDSEHQIIYGRFENLRTEALRLFEETGTPITSAITDYLAEAKPLNASPRPVSFVDRYGPDLEQLVAVKDGNLIDQFGYEFKEILK